jgi:2-oxoglutarate ferredoxin oxidoreductase subunit alpha
MRKTQVKTHFWSGNEACAEAATTAGCRFFAGYPISPSNEIPERLSERLPQVGGIFLQMEDELASIGAVMGASWAGWKAMTATSGPGFSLMQETIGWGFMTETPCVIVDVQRVGPGTGQATRGAQGDVMQARWGTHGDYAAIALSPNSAQEMFELTIRAFTSENR